MKAIEMAGRLPTTEEVIKAFEDLTWERPDHQAVHGGLLGTTKFLKKHGFAILKNIVHHKAEDITPPLGTETLDWVRSIE